MRSGTKWDSLSLGLTIGIIAPVIAMTAYCFYYPMTSGMSVSAFVDLLIGSNAYIKVMSLSVIINLALFFLALRRDLNYSARGILLASFIYVGLIVFLKFFT